MTIVISEYPLADQERQQRASAPTLRDLLAAEPSVSPSKDNNETGQVRQPELAALGRT